MRARKFRSIAVAVVALLVALALAAPAGAAPANDEIVAAAELPATLPSSTPGTTVGATGEAGEKVFGNEVKASVWYVWNAPATGPVVIDLCGPFSGGSEVLTGLGAYTGSGPTFAGLTKVADTAGPCKLQFAAVAATTYKIQVATLRGEADFVLALHAPQPPANDNFAAAQVIAGLPVSVAGSTIEATFQAGEPDRLGKSGGSRSVWFSWTAPSSGHVQLEGCPFETQRGSARNMAMGVYTGTTLGALTPVVETNNCKVEFDAVATTTYKIAFSGNFAGEGTFPLTLHEAPPPANDNIAAAILLGAALPQSISGDNSFATTEPEENKVAIGGITGSTHSVWYRWTAAETQLVKLNACGQDGRPRLGVFTGTTIATLKVANLPLGFAPFCAAELEAVAGTTYSLAVAGGSFEGSTGPFVLELHKVRRPDNDTFTEALPIGPDLPIVVDGSNVDASAEAGEVSPSFFNEPRATVWYRWKSSITGPVDISTCGSAADSFAGVHTGIELATLTRLVPSGEDEPGSCPDPGQNGALEHLMAVAGTTYWIQISGFRSGLEGPFHLTITDPNAKPPAAPKNDNPASPPAAVTTIAPAKKPTLKDAIAQCRKQFPGKGKQAKAKRADCIVKAKRRFAIAKCREGKEGAQRRKCIAAARERFQPGRPQRHT